MKSPLGTLLRNATNRRPPVQLGNGAAFRRGLAFNLGNGRHDAETFMRQYGLSGTLYGIISLLAESAATPPWHLYKKQPVDGRRRYTTSDQGSDQRIEVVQHAAIQLWNSPNDWHSGFEFREASQQHQELTGETFWVLDTEAGFPTGMWCVRPDRMEPVPDPEDYLTGWIYTGPGGENVPLKADEVILEKRPDPLDPYRGAGPVASILPNVQQQRYATEYQRNLFLNGADPGGVITVPNRLGDQEFDELIDRWREGHRGIARAGHVGVLEAGATWAPNAHSNKDMEYGQLRLANRDELREAWRIHKTMMGTADDVNRANAQTAQEVFVAWQVLPRLNRRRDTLNSKLLPLFGSSGVGVEFDYEDPSPVNAETAANELFQKSQAAALLIGTNRFDPADVLEAVGLPDMAAVAPPPPPPKTSIQIPAVPAAEPTDYRRPVINLMAPPAQPQPPQQLQSVDQQWKRAVADLAAAWLSTIIPAWYAQLAAQIRHYIATDNLPGLAVLQVDPAQATALILDHTSAYASTAAKQAANEAQAQGAGTIAPQTPTREQLEAAAAMSASLLGRQIALSAGREAARVGSLPDADPDAVAADVRAFLDNLSDASVLQAAAGVLSAAQNQSRLATIAAGPRALLVATEMHDTNTCKPCDDINGYVFGNSDDPAAVAAAQAAYPGGGYVDCEGGPRCRGTMYADYTTARQSSPADRHRPGISAKKDAAARVFEQEAADYPASAIAWMHHATWKGPILVPLEHIDWTPNEMDGVDPDHVREFVKKLRAGKRLKPVVLVKTPSGDQLTLADGHHRYLAAAELEQPVRAYVGTVDADHGPWEAMHEYQYRDAKRQGQRPAKGAKAQAANTTDMTALLRTVMSDGYVPVQISGRR